METEKNGITVLIHNLKKNKARNPRNPIYNKYKNQNVIFFLVVKNQNFIPLEKRFVFEGEGRELPRLMSNQIIVVWGKGGVNF